MPPNKSTKYFLRHIVTNQPKSAKNRREKEKDNSKMQATKSRLWKTL